MNKYILFVCLLLSNVQILFGTKVLEKKQNSPLELKIDSLINIQHKDQQTNLTKIDSLKIIIDESNQSVIEGIGRQTSELKDLEERITNPEKTIFWEFIYPIIVSIIAAIIFWFAFSYYPEYTRKRKIREKINLEIYQVYTNIFTLFDIVFQKNSHSPSDYQNLIRGEKLSRRDIEIGLQNKCLNETYIYYPELQDSLLPIGKSLWNYSHKIDIITDKIFNFSMYLNSEEILLLENIRNKLFTYDIENYDRSAISVINGVQLKPVNPSISYMTNNFMELYGLFSQLQKLVFRNKLKNRNVFISNIQYLFYNGQYTETIKVIEKGLKNHADDKIFLNWYIFQCLYKLDRKLEAYTKLESLFEKKENLISNRNFLENFLEDKEIESLLNKYYTANDLKDMKTVIEKEKIFKKSFIENAKLLEEFYAKKGAETLRK